MAFNKEKFIAEARAAGYSEDQINAELGGSTAPAQSESPIKVDIPSGVAGALEPPAMPQAAPSPATQPAPERKATTKKPPVAETKQEKPLIPEWLQLPAAVGAGGAAVAGAVTGWKTLRDKMNNSTPAAGVERREPTMFGAQRLDEPAWSASSAQTSPLTQEEMMNRLRGLADETSAVNEPALGTTAPAAQQGRNLTLEEAQARMAGVTPPAAPVAPAAPMAPVAPAMVETPQPIPPSAEKQAALADYETKIAASDEKIQKLSTAQKLNEDFIRRYNESTAPTTPARPVVPTPPAALASTTAAPTPTAESINPSAYNQRVQTAIAGVPKNVQEQLAKEGKVALKGYGAGDVNVTNTFGPPAYQKLVDYFNEGKPIGSYENYLEVNKKIQKGVPASLASEFASALPASEKEAGNFGKAFGEVAAYTKDGKIVKSPNAIKNAVAGGGAVVLLTSIPNLANAATNASQGKYSQAGGQAAEVGMNFMPPALQALTYAKGAGEGEDTELARQRRMAEYVQRAGRGVAQGYDPRRLIGVAPPAR
jgi:hypothetical protein